MTGYQALREGAGWLDLDRRGRFWISGEDRARLLHAMTTNHIEQMNTGDSCYTFFLNDKGRILGDANVLAMEDRFLLDTEPETHDALFQHLDKYIIADDATLTDARKEITAIGVEGPLSRQVIDAIAGFGRAPFTVTGGAGARFFVPSAEREAFVARLESFGAVRASAEDARVVRLENFRPRYGEDFTDKSLVQETQLLHAVHFTKGCYLGQEIVERVRSRGQVHRLLVPLYVAGKEPPAAASPVKAGEAAVGETMSSAYSPALGKSVAFAVIRAEHARPGTPLTIDGAAAEVAAAKGI